MGFAHKYVKFYHTSNKHRTAVAPGSTHKQNLKTTQTAYLGYPGLNDPSQWKMYETCIPWRVFCVASEGTTTTEKHTQGGTSGTAVLHEVIKKAKSEGFNPQIRPTFVYREHVKCEYLCWKEPPSTTQPYLQIISHKSGTIHVLSTQKISVLSRLETLSQLFQLSKHLRKSLMDTILERKPFCTSPLFWSNVRSMCIYMHK